MDAYSILKEENFAAGIDTALFYQLIIRFRENYFKEVDYKERLLKHRKPASFLNELLQGKHHNEGLYRYLQIIQGREEMRDLDSARNCYGYVNSKIEEILEEDRAVKTLYEAIKIYCNRCSKDFNTVAVHIAEYRAMNYVLRKINRDIKRLQNVPTKNIETPTHTGEITDPHLNREKCYQKHIHEMDTIRSKFEIVRLMTEDEAEKDGIPYSEGLTISFIPKPINHNEAYKFFTEYIGQTMCSCYKYLFCQKYGSWLEPNIKAELASIEKFISETNDKDYRAAVEATNKNNDNYHYCYLRLKNGYYLYNNFDSRDMVAGSPLASVYGQYFLFYDYLKTLLPKEQFAAVLDNENGLVKEVMQLLNNYPDIQELYLSALEKIKKGLDNRNALDDLRLSLELFLKRILDNGNSLEKQKSAIGKHYQSIGLSVELSNMFVTLLDYYGKYNNSNVKHNDNVKPNDVDTVLNLTSMFIKTSIPKGQEKCGLANN